MNQRGRKSGAALSVVGDGTGLAQVIAPPVGLTEAESVVWQETVNSKAANWFGMEHVPVLVEYVRHVCRAHVLDDQLRAFDKEWLATDEGLSRYEKLATMSTRTAGMITRLATTMRLTHQAIYRADKAGMTGKGRKLWQREPD